MKRAGSILIPETDREEDFFIGWAGARGPDRRFLLGAVPAIAAFSGGMGWLVASELGDPGDGTWQTGAIHSVTGRLVREPYPMIRSLDETGRDMTTLLVATGKCTSSLDLAVADGGLHTASGVLIERRGRHMLEVPLETEDWLSPAPEITSIPPATEEIVATDITLQGMIMDTKCFFGVMRPGFGRTHKACAALCIRGGIPPSFWARTKDGREVVMLVTDENGAAVGTDILPLVAETVEASGTIVQQTDWLQFRVAMRDYRLV